MQHRPINQIAREIQDDWTNINYAAKPYLRAMYTMENLSDYYGMDTAKSIIIYFLSNARTWRGETARQVKTELKTIVGI